jgi:DNA processing protein
MSALPSVLNAEPFFRAKPISPWRELAAYEALWANKKASFKTLAECFRKHPDRIPSELVDEHEIEAALTKVEHYLRKVNLTDIGIRVYGTEDYPEGLRDAAYPVELLYYRGWWDLVNSPKRIAVVGARDVSNDGVKRTKRLVRLLVEAGYTIVSGLARGVDTVAHRTAIKHGGRTIAVLGTPITEYYPKENRDLQDEIARDHLLISQIPMCRYLAQDFRANRLFFPERNVTMSALSQATVIVEASDTSGALKQARAALQQGRKLFILESNFRNAMLTWPARFEAMGAIRVRGTDITDIQTALG